MHPVHGYIGKQKSRVAADDLNYLGSPDEDYDGVDKPDTGVKDDLSTKHSYRQRKIYVSRIWYYLLYNLFNFFLFHFHNLLSARTGVEFFHGISEISMEFRTSMEIHVYQ